MRNISSRKLNAGLVALAALSSVLVTGCSSEGIVDAPNSEEKVSLQVQATIGGASSKAATNLNEAGNFESGDQILIYSCNTTRTIVINDTYTFDGTSWKSDVPHYLTEGYSGPTVGLYPGEEVTFTVSHLMAGATTLTTAVQLDQSEKEGYKKSDLMFANNTSVTYTNPTCNLTFTHQLCKIVIDLSEALDGQPATNAQVSLLNVKPGVNASVGTDAVRRLEATGEAEEITLKTTTQSATAVAGIIPPQTIAAGDKFIKIVIDGVTYTGALSSTEDKTFVGNTVYTYKISILGATQFTVSQATISEWGTINESEDITVENE